MEGTLIQKYIVCICALLAFFMIVLSPSVLDEEIVSSHFCVDITLHNDTEGWLYSGGDGEGACKEVDLDGQRRKNLTIADLKAVFGIPSGRGNETNNSRVEQTPTATATSATRKQEYLKFATKLIMDANNSAGGEWKPFPAPVERWRLSCDDYETAGWQSCSVVPVFENYLLNVKLSSEDPDLNHIRRAWLKVTTKNKRLSVLWLGLKTVYVTGNICIGVYAVMSCLFWSVKFVATVIPSLMIALYIFIMNMPIDFVTFVYYWPPIALLKHVKITLFCMCQFFLWYIFIVRHKLIPSNGLSFTKRSCLCGVGFTMPCLILTLIDLIPTVQYMSNPFNHICEAIKLQTVSAVIMVSGLLLILHTFYLQYYIWQRGRNMRKKDNQGQTMYRVIAKHTFNSFIVIIFCMAVIVVEYGKIHYIDGVRFSGYSQWGNNILQRTIFWTLDVMIYIIWSIYCIMGLCFLMPGCYLIQIHHKLPQPNKNNLLWKVLN